MHQNDGICFQNDQSVALCRKEYLVNLQKSDEANAQVKSMKFAFKLMSFALNMIHAQFEATIETMWGPLGVPDDAPPGANMRHFKEQHPSF